MGKKGGKKGGFYYEGGRADGKMGGKKNGDCYYGYNGGRADGKKTGKKGGYGGFGGKKTGKKGYYGSDGGRNGGVVVEVVVTESVTVQGQVEAEAVRGQGFVN